MIFRRIKAHVEKENWFAVFVDFCIVVIGVFIGIQVANWNEARASQVREAEHLRQLRDEIAQTADMASVQADFVDHVIGGGRMGLAFLEGETPCLQDCERLVIAFFHASQVWGTGYPDEKFQETVRLGIPKDEALREQILQVYAFIEGWSTVNAVPPAYRERVRGLISPDAMSILWQGCYQITGQANEVLTFDCEDDLRAVDLEPTLERILNDPELAMQLRFWVGQNEYARLNNPLIIDRSDTTMQSITNALEAGL